MRMTTNKKRLNSNSNSDNNYRIRWYRCCPALKAFLCAFRIFYCMALKLTEIILKDTYSNCMFHFKSVDVMFFFFLFSLLSLICFLVFCNGNYYTNQKFCVGRLEMYGLSREQPKKNCCHRTCVGRYFLFLFFFFSIWRLCDFEYKNTY